jgi:hypothetical protein
MIIVMYLHPNVLRAIGLIFLGVLVCLVLFILLSFSIGWDYFITQPLRQSRDRWLLASLLDVNRQLTTETPSHARRFDLAVMLIGGAFATFVACLPLPVTFHARAFALSLGMTGFLFGGTELLRKKVPSLERWCTYLALYIAFPLMIYFGIRNMIEVLLAR